MKSILLAAAIFLASLMIGPRMAAADVSTEASSPATTSSSSASAQNDSNDEDSDAPSSTLSATQSPTSTTDSTTQEEVDIDIPTGFFENFSVLFNGLLRFVIIIAALLTFVYLIWGSIDWITSGGDRGKTEAARSKLTSALIGLLVVAASYAILTIVLNFLGYESLEDVLNRMPMNQ